MWQRDGGQVDRPAAGAAGSEILTEGHATDVMVRLWQAADYGSCSRSTAASPQFQNSADQYRHRQRRIYRRVMM
jgi:hypothetical protein